MMFTNHRKKQRKNKKPAENTIMDWKEIRMTVTQKPSYSLTSHQRGPLPGA